MVHIDELVEPALLSDMLEQGYIRERRHAEYPYRILNYTETAAYSGVWNDATWQCRGLVINDQGYVIARPFEKFHNHSEHDGQKFPALDLFAPVKVTDKLDGSLGILVPKPDASGYIIATRGSFDSEQAQWATRFYNEHYGDFQPNPALTYLLEIIYKGNRIVVDYDYEDLVLIGMRHTETGEEWHPVTSKAWPGRIARTFDADTLAEALALPPRKNAEGLVVQYDTGQRVKIKQEDYIRLHKLVTGLNERAVWEHMSAGLPFEALIEGIPDEFHRWVTDVWDELWTRYDTLHDETGLIFRRVIERLERESETRTRKEFALLVADLPNDLKPFMFLWWDDDKVRINNAIWKRLRPEGDTRMWNQPNEDAA
ncbi:RNA ligase [Nocardia asiatica]|uniref:RNA ligase n=1 Tax=Nocardia asiatica TaxID=209252 RepID=UPI0024562FED|nr:RNA ligase [Nocardia asiatica]